MTQLKQSVDVSVIIPVGDRQGDMIDLYDGYSANLRALGVTFETIFVLDGPQVRAASAIQQLMNRCSEVTLLQLTRSFGESVALMAAFEHAGGASIITLPAYSQIEGNEIGKLLAGLASADLCIARRWPRRGGPIDVLRRGIFHWLVSRITGVPLRDLGCGARAFRRRVLEEITLYGEQHRFLGVLANRQGFTVAEIDVRQSGTDHFAGHYSTQEYARSMLDLCTVFFLVRFTKRPLRFFGMVGVTTLSIGIGVVIYLVAARIFADHALADRPALLLASLLVVLGLQLFALGLLGELIIFTHAKNIKDYQIAEVVAFSSPDVGAKAPKSAGQGGTLLHGPADANSPALWAGR